MPSNYFVDHKRGEVNELRGQLRNPKLMRDPKKQREITKKVIAYMTLGIDVSKLFSEMIMASHTKDLVIKKMIYLYLCNYAQKKKDLAVLAINTLRKDAKDDDPMIRGLALRSLCSLQLPSIVEYVIPLLRSGIKDASSYVRKTAAMGCGRLFRISPDSFRAGKWGDALRGMITDREASVAINALNTLEEVERESGGLKADAKTILPLVKRIREFNEWGQCAVLNVASRFTPTNQQQMFGIMNHLDHLLKHSNCAVVLATTKVYLNFTINFPKVHKAVIQRLKVPLLTLMSSSSFELAYTVLCHLRVLVSRAPDIFLKDYKHFYCRHNEPTSIKKIKQDIIVALAEDSNASELLNELSEYITDNPQIAKQAVHSIGKIAVKSEEAVDEGIELLLSFIDIGTDFITATTCGVLKDILRKFPDRYEDVIPSLQKVLKSVESPEGRASVIWLIGEYGETITDAPYILETLIDNFQEETNHVRGELLTATMKLFFKRPPELHKMLGRVLKAAVEDTNFVDVRDQALFYYRLLRLDPHEAGRIVNCEKAKVSAFAETQDSEINDIIFEEFNSLSVVYSKPAARFTTYRRPEIKDPVSHPGSPAQGPPRVSSPSRSLKSPPMQILHTETPLEVKREPEVKAKPAPATIDILASLADEGPEVETSIPSNPTLLLKPKLAAQMYKKKWSGLKQKNVFNAKLRTPVPGVKAIESMFRPRGIDTIASGAKGGLMKFYFYAQSAKDSSFFLVEANLEIASGKLVATIKAENTSLISEFEAEIKSALSGVV
ncbi:hypothetical protein AAMO2058_000577600 [Amorphochlora amoebiformis]